jgi:uncharacterized protein (TIGR00369 family)
LRSEMPADMPSVIRNPFVEWLGPVLATLAAGTAEMTLAPQPGHINSWGVAHGGVLMTLLDVTMAHAARSPVEGQPDDPRGVATIEMKTSFVRPGTGPLTARARRLHRTGTLAFCEGSVFDASGALVAHASGTFKYLRALPVGHGRVARQQASD